MKSLFARLEAPIMAAAGKLGQQPHLNAIRDGVVGALPLVLIGSLFILVAQPPLPNQQLLDKYAAVMIYKLPAFLQTQIISEVLLYGIVLLAVLVLLAIIGRLLSVNATTISRIRQGVLGALALAAIAHIGVIIYAGWPDWWGVPEYGVSLMGQLLVVFRILVGLIGLFVAFGVGHSLAKRYGLDALSAGLLSAAALLLVNGLQMATPAGAEGAVRFIPMVNLGSGGLFMAIFLGLIIPEVQRVARDRKWEIKMPDGVPPAVGRSFSALIPGLLVIIPLWAIVHVLGIDLFGVINNLLTEPIAALSKSGTSVFIVLAVIILIDSVLWLLGVHAVAILAPMAAIWLANMTANTAAVEIGHSAQFLNTREMLVFFVWLGGSGATLVLPFLLLRARAASLRAIAKVGLVPAVFNINEPLIFGVPVMMNLTLAIPFALAPLVTLTTTVLAINSGIVPIPYLVVPWTLPGPVGAYLTTGGSWQAAVLVLINIALAALIYWPFVRALDRRVAAQEAAAQQQEVAATA